MSLYFRGELCIVNGSILQPDLMKGARLQSEDGKLLGIISRGDRKTLSLEVEESLLQGERSSLTLNFLAELVTKVEERGGEVILTVPEGPFLGPIELANNQFTQLGFPGMSTFMDMYEKPLTTNFMALLRQKKQEYKERLKRGERRFHEHRLG